MQFGLPQRLAATGMIGLAVLSATHWLRENLSTPGPVISFALGVMPNLAAAFAMPLILATFSPRSSGVPISPESHRIYLLILSFTTLGLCGWEIIQINNNRFVFDIYDIVATCVGAVLAHIAFTWHVRRFEVKEKKATVRGEA